MTTKYKLEVISQTTISYDATGASSAYLMLVQPFTNTTYNYLVNANETSHSINTSALPSGIYTVILVCNGEVADAKSLQIN